MSKFEKSIQNYTRQVKLRKYNNLSELWRNLNKKYGTSIVSSLEECISLREAGKPTNIYPILYQNLDLSLDVLSYFEFEFHESYLKWFLEKDIKSVPKILDLGCGNGFLTCFYAKIFPNSEIIGVDKYPEAINCASELAQKLGLTNIKFFIVDLSKPFVELPFSSFDLITSVAVYNDVIGIPSQDKSIPIKILMSKYADTVFVDALKNITSLLAIDTGMFISLEKLNGVRAFSWWISALSNIGIKINYQYSGQINYKCIDGEIEKIPVICANVYSESTKIDINDALGFWLQIKYQNDFKKFRTFDFQGELAETAFDFINPKIFRFGMKTENEGLICRMEIWQAGPFLLVNKFNNTGQHTLEVIPSIFYHSAQIHVEDLMKINFGSQNVIAYTEPYIN